MTNVRAAAILTERLGRLVWDDPEAVALRRAIKSLFGARTWAEADELLEKEFQRIDRERKPDVAAR
jgi:hypothetical protein